MKGLKYWEALNIYGQTVCRDKCTASTEYVSLIGLHNHALRVTGILARFRDINFNGYRHCVNPNTPIEAIRNPARQHQSRDVKVGNNPTARTLSFGKEIEGHTIQQGSLPAIVKETKVNGVKGRDASKPVESTPPLAAWEGIHATFVQMPPEWTESTPPTGIHATCWNPPKI
ncbi:hypothetical protein R3P38DRAFT_2799396 [Favolaschia claudopus]|uniref:Uncharacterized protein n=1 Tax=Favolaschia claudopus TaxID=2862362 RepID=A0AAW0A106_9AGAR